MTKMREDTLSDFTQLQIEIRQKTIAADAGFSHQLEDTFTKTQVEIHEYKKKKFQEINQQMDAIVLRVIQEVTGQMIPVANHQQLIIQALEKAEKEGIFPV